MGQNSASIDLVGDPTKLNEAIESGTDRLHEFSEDAMKALDGVGKDTESLAHKFGSIADRLAELVKQNQSAAAAQGEQVAATHEQAEAVSQLLGTTKEQIGTLAALGATTSSYSKAVTASTVAEKANTAAHTTNAAAIAKESASLALSLATTIKFNLIMLATSSTVKAAGYVFANTGKQISTIDPRLEATRKLLVATNGGIEALDSALKQLGLSSEEAGIKIETNLSRIKEAFGKAFSESVGKSEDAINKSFGTWEEYWAKLAWGMDRNAEIFTKAFVAIGNDLTAEIKEWQNTIADTLAAGVSEANLKANQVFREQNARLEAIAKENKVAEINKAMHKKELDEYQKYIDDKSNSAKAAKEAEIVATYQTVARVKLESTAHAELRQQLILSGQYQGKVADIWLAKDQALIARENELAAAVAARRKEVWKTSDDLHTGKSRGEQEEKDKFNNAIQIASLGVLNALLEDELELYDKINQKGAKAAEETAKSEEKLAALEQAIHDKKLKNIEEENDRKLHAAKLDEELAKTRRDNAREIDSERSSVAQDRRMRALELQGATEKQLHVQRMKFIAEEEKTAIKNLDVKDPIRIEQIKNDAAKQRIREEAAFKAQKLEETAALDRVIQAEKQRLDDEAFEKKKTSEEERHKHILEQIRREAGESLIGVTDAVRKKEVELDLQRKITDEQKRFLDLKKGGVDVGAKIDLNRPLTMKEQREANRRMKQQQKDMREQVKAEKGLAALRKRTAAREKKKPTIQPKAIAANATKVEAAKQVKMNQDAAKQFADGFKQMKDDVQAKARAAQDTSLFAKTARNLDRQLVKMDNLITAVRDLNGIGKLK